MKGKDLRPKSCQLIRYYRYANKMAFNVSPNVHKHLDRFIAFEKKLLTDHIFPRSYAFTIVHLLRSWVKDKKFTYLPVNVFLGVWAYNKYMKVHESQYVQIQYDADQRAKLLYDELNVARLYIQCGGTCKLSKIVYELQPLLSDEWLECYRAKTRPVCEAMDILCFEYNLPYAADYNDIIALQV